MRYFSFPAVFLALILGCAHMPEPAGPEASAWRYSPAVIRTADSGGFFRVSTDLATGSPDAATGREGVLIAATDGSDPKSDGKDGAASGTEKKKSGEPEEGSETSAAGIADPLEPFNRAMYHFNDKLYFWVLKPAAQGYGRVVPEPARTGIRNFFENLKFPIRFVNNLLQANLDGAISELGRFTVNTLWGVGGLLDPASKKELDIPKYDADLGQTLGVYGLGPGFYIVWPVLGPSSARDTVEIVGDYFLDPVSYINPLYASIGTRAYEIVNDTSLRIGDYESLQEAAIDPYVALWDAYTQYWEEKIKKRKQGPPKPGGVR